MLAAQWQPVRPLYSVLCNPYVLVPYKDRGLHPEGTLVWQSQILRTMETNYTMRGPRVIPTPSSNSNTQRTSLFTAIVPGAIVVTARSRYFPFEPHFFFAFSSSLLLLLRSCSRCWPGTPQLCLLLFPPKVRHQVPLNRLNHACNVVIFFPTLF